jgi:small ligand-binding sensory domain FIST
MKWSSAVSREIEAADAVKDCLASLRKDLGADASPDALFIFVSPHHSDSYDLILGQLNAALKPKHLLGCSGAG